MSLGGRSSGIDCVQVMCTVRGPQLSTPRNTPAPPYRPVTRRAQMLPAYTASSAGQGAARHTTPVRRASDGDGLLQSTA